MKFARFSRKYHRVGAIVIAIPLIVVIVSGLFLQLKKEWDWVQPPTSRGKETTPSIGFDAVLAAAASAPEAGIESWEDIDRLDVRVDRGMLKVRAKNGWEVQVDTATGEVLHVAYRRSDLIESIHDGSWFHERVKLWIFLPTGIVFLFLWVSGIHLWILPHLVRRRRRIKQG
jgi:uncharacterized iron-regulated membrane protein